jgi:hemolysin activation/secretion protein
VPAQSRISNRQTSSSDSNWSRYQLKIGRDAHRNAGSVLAETFEIENRSGRNKAAGKGLVAVARADGYTLAANGTAAAQHGCARLGLHTRAESMRLGAMAAVRLKCALGHKNALLLLE